MMPVRHLVRMADDAVGFALIDGLLETFTEVLDVREVFDRVSQLAQPMLPHDMMVIIQASETSLTVRLLVSGGPESLREPFELAVQQTELLTEPSQFNITPHLPPHPASPTP